MDTSNTTGKVAQKRAADDNYDEAQTKAMRELTSNDQPPMTTQALLEKI